MEINISPEYNNFLHGQVSAGNFQDYSQVIEAALRKYIEAESERGLIKEKLETAWQESENGQWFSDVEAKQRFASFKQAPLCA